MSTETAGAYTPNRERDYRVAGEYFAGAVDALLAGATMLLYHEEAEERRKRVLDLRVSLIEIMRSLEAEREGGR